MNTESFGRRTVSYTHLAGHFRTSVLLMTNSAFVISILLPFWGFTCGKGSTNFISLHYLCPESEDRLHLSIKNERVHFILHSVCTIFVVNRRILSMNGQYPSTLLEKAVNELAKLPGVGRKTAMRLVLHPVSYTHLDVYKRQQ